ncbi:MAG TPA: hypothetical protein VIM65_24960 [Cyclobacteriaceae bacterium]
MTRLITTLLLCVIAMPTFSQWATSGSNIYNTNSGGVGVGTSSPIGKFHVKSTSHSYLRLETSSSTYQTGLDLANNGQTLFYVFNDNANALKIRATITGETDAIPRMQFPYSNKNIYMVESGGNVGIGTTAPGQKLDVNGVVNATGFYINGQPFAGGGSQWATSPSGTSISYTVSNGSVGIGTSLTNNPNSYKLAVKGKIGAQEVQVENTSTTWADYVFEPTYKLRPLKEVRKFVELNKHLPEIPSAAEVRENGHKLGEMDVLLLKKIEEMTLYMLEQEERIKSLEEQVLKLKRK